MTWIPIEKGWKNKWHFLIHDFGNGFQLTCVSWYPWAEPPPRSWNWPSCWVDCSPVFRSWNPSLRRQGRFRTKTRSRLKAEGATSWKRTGEVRCWCEPGWFGWPVWSKLPEARFKVFVHLSKSFAGKNHKNSFDGRGSDSQEKPFILIKTHKGPCLSVVVDLVLFRADRLG